MFHSAPRVRRGLSAALMIGALAGATACGTGFSAQTNQIYNGTEGVTVRGNGVDVLNALVVTDGSGSGTLSGTLLNQRSSADKLVSVDVSVLPGNVTPTSGQTTASTAPASPSAPPTIDVSASSSLLSLEPHVSVLLGDPQDTQGSNALIFLHSSHLQAGYFVKITFTFTNASAVTTEIPVVVRSSEYASVATPPAG
ncbi:MAG: hypothetical protein ACRDP1_13020 [Nocardioidaceae bacterium]